MRGLTEQQRELLRLLKEPGAYVTLRPVVGRLSSQGRVQTMRANFEVASRTVAALARRGLLKKTSPLGEQYVLSDEGRALEL